MKKLMCLFLTILLLCSVAFTGALAEGGKDVYLLYPFMGFPYITALMDRCEADAAEMGINLTIFDGQSDDNLQYEQAMKAIDDNVDCCIVCIVSDKGLTIIRQLAEAGIPCVILNQQPPEGSEKYYSAAIMGNDYHHGQVVAENVIKAHEGEENVKFLVIEGMLADSGSEGRTKGFTETLLAAGNFELLDSQSASWDKGQAITIVEDWIVKYGEDIDIIYGCDDSLAVGAIEALEDAGLLENVEVYSAAGSSIEGIAAMKAGKLAGCAMHDPYSFADTCFETVNKILLGEEIEQDVYVPDPYYDVSTIGEYPNGDGTW